MTSKDKHQPIETIPEKWASFAKQIGLLQTLDKISVSEPMTQFLKQPGAVGILHVCPYTGQLIDNHGCFSGKSPRLSHILTLEGEHILETDLRDSTDSGIDDRPDKMLLRFTKNEIDRVKQMIGLCKQLELSEVRYASSAFNFHSHKSDDQNFSTDCEELSVSAPGFINAEACIRNTDIKAFSRHILIDSIENVDEHKNVIALGNQSQLFEFEESEKDDPVYSATPGR